MNEDQDLEAQIAATTAALSEARAAVAASDDIAQVKVIGEVLNQLSELTSEYARVRREKLETLIYEGKTQSELARALGISTARMSRLIKSGPPPERAFLGAGRLTVVVGEKPEEGNNRPVIALETVGSYTRLIELATAYRLEASYETVPPPGIFDLNRNNLIVLSGPRLFPIVGQFLQSDPNIRFETDADGEWILRDHQTGEVYKNTPRGGGGPVRDFGYLGRLTRPDEKGTFLCLGGLHATGTQGIVAYLEKNLPYLYGEVKTRKFSMVIESEYDPDTHEIINARQASPIYKRS